MRQIINPQLQLGEVDIGAVALDVTSRDDIPRLLRGLQHIYTDVTLREQVFAILAEVLPMRDDGDGPVSITTGRPGMAQWQILVLGVLRRHGSGTARGHIAARGQVAHCTSLGALGERAWIGFHLPLAASS